MENKSPSRSTVSFHLSANEKERLVQAAWDSFGSITDYIKFKLFYNEDKKDLAQAQSRIRQLEARYDTLKSTSPLNDPGFNELYNQVKGKELSFKGEKDMNKKIIIHSKESLFLLMTKCFEICN